MRVGQTHAALPVCARASRNMKDKKMIPGCRPQPCLMFHRKQVLLFPGACIEAGSGSRSTRLLTGTFSTELGSANAPGLHSRKFARFRQAVFRVVWFRPVRASGRRTGWRGRVGPGPGRNRKDSAGAQAWRVAVSLRRGALIVWQKSGFSCRNSQAYQQEFINPSA